MTVNKFLNFSNFSVFIWKTRILTVVIITYLIWMPTELNIKFSLKGFAQPLVYIKNSKNVK